MRGSMQETSIASYWPSAAKLREGDRARSPALPASSKKRRRSTRVLQHAPPPPGNSGGAPPPRPSLLCREPAGEKSPRAPKLIASMVVIPLISYAYGRGPAPAARLGREAAGRGDGAKRRSAILALLIHRDLDLQKAK